MGGRKRGRRISGGKIFRGIISTGDGENQGKKDLMKIRRLIWDFQLTKICKDVEHEKRPLSRPHPVIPATR